MLVFKLKVVLIVSLLAASTQVLAEGIIDLKPYVITSINHDDNLFRLSSKQQAIAVLGSENMADTVARLQVGADLNLRLSRQLFQVTTSINADKYSRFNNLDNTGNNLGLRWDWRFGNDVYGILSANKRKSIAGFDQTRTAVKNVTTLDRQTASINWDFHPDWTLFLNSERYNFINEAISSVQLDREDKIIETGLRFTSPLDTQLAISYRIVDASFANRTGLLKTILGSKNSQKELVFTAAWLVAPKTRISTRISKVNLSRDDSLLTDFSGLNQRWMLDYSASAKLNFNMAVFQVLSPIDDVATTYVKQTGFEINPTWNFSSKVALRANLSYLESAFIGSERFIAGQQQRQDASTQASLSLIYAPTIKSQLQLQYTGEKRNSTIENAGYQFNNLNFLVRYDF